MSSDWSEGYITGTIYTDNFFRELSPAWLNYVAALNGCLPIALDKPFTYLELGCGLGRSTTVFAAAFPKATFIGVDFNPAHIALARRSADVIGVQNVSFLERSFSDLSSTDVPLCDFIVLHGVYTWVNAQVRAEVRRIISQHLKAGGLVYVSYNSLPGWAADSPLRKLMVELSVHVRDEPSDAVLAALQLMENLNSANFAYLKANPATTDMLKALKSRGQNYLAHEFLNAEWALFYSCDIADEMAEAKLTFLGSATLVENHPEYLVDKEAVGKINAEKSPRLRQLLLDYAINQRFRRDVYVRGHQRLGSADREVAFGTIPLGCPNPDQLLVGKGKVGAREVVFAEKLFPLIKAAIGGGAKTISELRLACRGITDKAPHVDHLLASLVAGGFLMPFARDFASYSIANDASTTTVNRSILDRAVVTRSRQHLVSPLAGTGVPVDPAEAILTKTDLANDGNPCHRETAFLALLRDAGLKLTADGQGHPLSRDERELASDFISRFVREKKTALACLGVSF